jgi:hypothetical protein
MSGTDAFDEGRDPSPQSASISEMRKREDEAAERLLVTTRRFFLAIGDPYGVWFQYFQSSTDLTVTSRDSLRMVRRFPDLWANLLNTVNSAAPSEHRRDLRNELRDEMQSRAVKAAAEIDLGFPRLHAHSLMGLWGALTTFVDDAAAAVLLQNPTLVEAEHIRTVASRMGLQPTRASPQAEYRDLLRHAFNGKAYRRWIEDNNLQGEDVFEKKLRLVNLNGVTPFAVARDLRIARRVRNIWAHRGGMVDDDLSSLLPQWLPGERAYIDPGLSNRLDQAMFVYAQVILARWCDLFGIPRVILDAPLYPRWEDELPPEPVKIGAGGLVVAGPGMPFEGVNTGYLTPKQ